MPYCFRHTEPGAAASRGRRSRFWNSLGVKQWNKTQECLHGPKWKAEPRGPSPLNETAHESRPSWRSAVSSLFLFLVLIPCLGGIPDQARMREAGVSAGRESVFHPADSMHGRICLRNEIYSWGWKRPQLRHWCLIFLRQAVESLCWTLSPHKGPQLGSMRGTQVSYCCTIINGSHTCWNKPGNQDA